MLHWGMLGEIIAAGDGVEILAEVLDQILDLVRQHLVRNLGEEDAEELEDVLVVERRSLIEQDGVYILQEPVAARQMMLIITEEDNFLFSPFHQQVDSSVEGGPLDVTGTVDIQPQLGEQLEVERNSVQTNHGGEVDQHLDDAVFVDSDPDHEVDQVVVGPEVAVQSSVIVLILAMSGLQLVGRDGEL